MAFSKKVKKTVEEDNIKDVSNEDNKQIVANKIIGKLNQLENEIVERNSYMNERDKILYDPESILEDITIKPGFDYTKYNFLPRAKEIHTFQVMGRGFSILTQYDKDDTSLLTKGTEEYQNAIMKNTERATQASNAKALLDGVVKDNGGKALWMNLAATASGYGVGIIKKWVDPKTKEVNLVSIESVQNFRAGWSSTNFRKRDFDAIVYEISEDSAYADYKSELKDGQKFSTANKGNLADSLKSQTSRPMCQVIDFVGMVPGINNNEPFYCKIVGGIMCGFETKKLYFPKYYLFQNRERLRRPWGASDISDEAIDCQKTYIAQMSDYITLLKKMFPFLVGRGFEGIQVPKKIEGEVQFFPVGMDQDIEIKQFQPGTYPYSPVLSEIKESLFRILGLGRVMIDDPTVSFESNSALMTGMKSTIDIAEDKQTRWKQVFIELFNDILDDLKELDKNIAKAIGDEYTLDIEWPSVLRKDDASYDSMLLNKVRSGLISIETYLEKIGIANVSEEIERIKGNMQDPVLGAILSANLRTVNMQAIQEGYGMEVQPTSQMTAQAGQQPTGAPLTTEQNQTEAQPMSMPGSGAPAVSVTGAQATMQQNLGQ